MLRERECRSQGELIPLLVSRGGLLPAAHGKENKEHRMEGDRNESYKVVTVQSESFPKCTMNVGFTCHFTSISQEQIDATEARHKYFALF